MSSINHGSQDIADDETEENPVETNEMIITDVIDDILTKDIDDNIFNNKAKDKYANIPLQKRLDLKKLLEFYENLMATKQTMSQKNDLLNKALLKCFRLKKIIRATFADNPDQLPHLIEKYFESLRLMKEKISRRKFVENDSKTKCQDLLDKIKNFTNEKDDNIQVFENDFKVFGLSLTSSQTGKRFPEMSMDNLIKRMNIVRNQISQQRLIFIQTLDKHTWIKEEAKCLENLGNGLRMVDFEEMRAERQSLADKIEERNNELAKLRKRCLADTLILAHVREKEVMIDDSVAKDSFDMSRIEIERNCTRNYLNDLKINLIKCRKEFADLSQACGLLDKPDLLVDFDIVNKLIRENRLIYEQLNE